MNKAMTLTTTFFFDERFDSKVDVIIRRLFSSNRIAQLALKSSHFQSIFLNQDLESRRYKRTILLKPDHAGHFGDNNCS